MGYKICAFTRFERAAAMAMYRIVWPMEQLTKSADFEQCAVVTQDTLIQLQKKRRLHELLGYDLYIMQRIVGPNHARPTALFDRLRESGRVVWETDDDLTDEHRWVGYGEWFEQTMPIMDEFVVSTPELGHQMERWGKPVHVAYNRVKVQHFAHVSQNAVRHFKDQLVIGLVGTRTHWGDWWLVRDALRKIQREHPEIQLVCAGYHPPYFDFKIAELAQMAFPLYPAILRQMDIRLCPLDAEDPFNASKSAISALEAMSAARPIGKKTGGAVPICSDTKQFRRVVQQRHNGLLVKDGNWYEAIKSLIEDRVLRQKLAVQGHRWVQTHRNITDAHEFHRAYTDILSGGRH